MVIQGKKPHIQRSLLGSLNMLWLHVSVRLTIFLCMLSVYSKTILHPLIVHQLKHLSVNSKLNLEVPKSLIINSCNLQLGKTIGQGK